jgi:hypothetical protein
VYAIRSEFSRAGADIWSLSISNILYAHQETL